MIELNLVQGSPEWLAHRQNYRNASDTPSVTGSSAYKSRAAFLKERATGITPEVDAATQRRFDDGHKFEAMARPLMEKIIGEDLFPVVGVDGLYSASFDGLTMMGDTNAEHKTLNDAIRACSTAAELPLMYREQMEHQMMVSGAGRSLFMASKWKINDDGEYILEEEKHFWYEPDMALRQKICAAWDQFEADVVAYVPVESIQVAVAEPTVALPSLFVQAKGEITTSNLTEFGAATAAYLAGIKTELVTDQDFANAKAAATNCRSAVEALELTKNQMLEQTVTIGEACRQIDKWKEDYRLMALALEKDVKEETENRRVKILNESKAAYAEYVAAINAEIAPVALAIAAPDFVAAMKGKKSIKGWQDAVNATLANGKVAAAASAKGLRDKLAWKSEMAAGYDFLFADLAQAIHKADDDFRLLITTRIANHKAAEEKRISDERERIRAEEQAKAQREADAKAAEERAAQAKEAARIAAQAAAAQKVIDDAAAEAKRAADAVAAQQLHDLAQQQAEQRKEEQVIARPVSIAPTSDGMNQLHGDIRALTVQMKSSELLLVLHYCERLIQERQVAA